MFGPQYKVFAERSHYGGSIKLYLSYEHRDGMNMMVADQVTFTQYPEFSQTPPALELCMRSAQALMDELWQCGIRPTNGTGSVGQLAATEKHLEDMRALAFKTGKPK